MLLDDDDESKGEAFATQSTQGLVQSKAFFFSQMSFFFCLFFFFPKIEKMCVVHSSHSSHSLFITYFTHKPLFINGYTRN